MAPPVPPFTRETAIAKVRGAEDGWNSRDPERVSKFTRRIAVWRNRAEFPRGRAEIIAFLTRKWARGTGLPADQGALGLHWQSDRRAFRL